MSFRSHLRRFREASSLSDSEARLQLISQTLLRRMEEEPLEIEDIEELFAILRLPAALPYSETFLGAFFHHLRHFPNDIDRPSAARCLSIDQALLDRILARPTREFRKAFFPVASPDGRAEIATLLLLPLEGDEPSVSFGSPSDPSSPRSKALSVLQSLTGQRFFVVFDRPFEGDSYMLALLAALTLPAAALEGRAFSGVVTSRGDISPVSFEDEKKRACLAQNLRYIAPPLIEHQDDLAFWLGSSNLPVPFLQLTSLEKAKEALSLLERAIQHSHPRFRLDKLFELFGLSLPDVVASTEGYLPEDPAVWMDFLHHTVRPRLQTLLASPHHEVSLTLHIGVFISSLAVGIGALLGVKYPAVLYQYKPGTPAEYVPTLDLSHDLRRIKRNLPQAEFEWFQVEEQALQPEQGIAIYAASHNPLGDAKADAFSRGWGFSSLRLRQHQGDLPTEIDWNPIVSEVYSYLSHLKEKGCTGSFHLYLSGPTAFFLALGMACGRFFALDVANWNGKNKTYSFVLRLEEIETL